MSEPNAEAIHAKLYQLHWALYRQAIALINGALEIAQRWERNSADERSTMQEYIDELMDIREDAERLLKRASKLRSKAIHHYGCDNSCEGKQP